MNFEDKICEFVEELENVHSCDIMEKTKIGSTRTRMTLHILFELDEEECPEALAYVSKKIMMYFGCEIYKIEKDEIFSNLIIYC